MNETSHTNLSFEERRILKQKVSAIQSEKEQHTRRLDIITLYGEVISMGGGSRHLSKQNRTGYPSTFDNRRYNGRYAEN